MSESKSRRCHFWITLAAVFVLTSPARGVVAFSFDDQLFAVDLETGSFDSLGPLETLDPFQAVSAAAASPSGEIFLLGADPEDRGSHSLLRFDLPSRSSTLIGTVASREPTIFDLAADDSGLLWLSTGRGLYVIDAASGADAFLGPTPGPLLGLAWFAGRLYGVNVDRKGVVRLVSVDPTTAETTPIRILDLGSSHIDIAFLFDAAGRAWIAGRYLSPLSAPVPTLQVVWRLDDLESGALVQTFDQVFDNGPLLRALAIPPGATAGSAIDVPTLDRTVILMLTILLAGCGMMATRRL